MYRKDLIALLSIEPRSVSSLARQMGLRRGDMEDDLRHALRSARATGQQITVRAARCRSCGFTFGEDRLAKPGKCPQCRGGRIVEAQIALVPTARS